MILKMTTYRLQAALLAQGWARDVRVSVSPHGLIAAIETGAKAPTASDVAVDGFVVPGMPNAHSHAFQRAMAGNTEYRLSTQDSFWTWRQAMYALANRIEPEDLEILATQLFIEMLQAGYTSVAEFHYLHRRVDGALYKGANALWQAVARAAEVAGIGLTFLPTLYQTANFGAQPLKGEQARFAYATDAFIDAVGTRLAEERRSGMRRVRTGVAFHILRAVPAEALRATVQALRRENPGLPVHIHVAEQTLEVEDCLRATGRRPVELLLGTGLLDEHWCLVHATHTTPEEIEAVARSRASICVSISTEANLGDGLFDTQRFLDAGGRLCVGSDSQSTVSPAEELRWLEYQQRLALRRRGVLASESDPHVGMRLWRGAALAGAAALGQPVGVLAVGKRADWLVLDAQAPRMAGAASESSLDHLLFAGGEAAIRDVMVSGEWVVRDHRHALAESLRPRFAALMQRLRR
jgi:formimidoylglutamate deiminase